MQAGLFEQQEKEDTLISSIVYDLFRCGKLHKFVESHIRKYYINNNQPYTDVLKHLRDVQTSAVGVCIAVSEISLPRPLKIDEVNLYFNSNFKDEELILETDKEYVLKNLSELRNTYSRIAGRCRFINNMRRSPAQSMNIYKSEVVLDNAFYELFDCLFDIDQMVSKVNKNDF